MRYTSTRAEVDTPFAQAVAGGLAAGGGLSMPRIWPRLDAAGLAEIADGSHARAVARIGALFSGPEIDAATWGKVADAAFAPFRHGAVTPLVEIGEGRWLLELFHGPTLSFKDYGLQPLGRLLETLSERDGRPHFILGATSGDTGSAGIAAFRGRRNARIVILHPHGRVSDIQRRQMTTIADDNVLNIALEGSFDDCQRIAKLLLAERAATGREAVLSVNSINWGRLLFQSAWYVRLSARLARLGRPVAFVIPSGNFGNAFAAIIARKIGAPVARLLLATNANDALAEVFETGSTGAGTAVETLAPAMDITIPSNLERLVWLLAGENPERTAAIMAAATQGGRLELPAGWHRRLPLAITASRVDDPEILDTIARVYRETDRILDPHTAVAAAASARAPELDGHETVIVATAHPAKFADAVERALGFTPPLPAPLAGLDALEERFTRCAATPDAVRAAIG